MASATGERRKQRELMAAAVAMKAMEETARRAMAAGRERSLWRPCVRGLRLSISQSARRLKVIAAVRAKTIAKRISPTMRAEGQPWAATTMEPSAKGRAKIVWENRMKARTREMRSGSDTAASGAEV